ncbi:MAG: DNA-deoxyinosine glycosylase, partial [Pseudomonadota bacterium]
MSGLSEGIAANRRITLAVCTVLDMTEKNQRKTVKNDKSTGFAPIVGKSPRILVLGSMPGQQSLREVRYYAHPRNSFWPIMLAWLGADDDLDYKARCQLIADRGVAVWDVLMSCH